jgi:hypothetical protein
LEYWNNGIMEIIKVTGYKLQVKPLTTDDSRFTKRKNLWNNGILEYWKVGRLGDQGKREDRVFK